MTEMKVDLMNKKISPRHHRHASDIGKVNPENHFPITVSQQPLSILPEAIYTIDDVFRHTNGPSLNVE